MTGHSSSCGACKFLRRRCSHDCIFAPYFSYEQAVSHFAAVHKVFGASNVSKLLLHLPVDGRSDAAVTISYEALARMQDPIYGCVAHIFSLQQQVASLKDEIETLGSQMASLGAESELYMACLPIESTGITGVTHLSSTSQHNLPMLYSENASVNVCVNSLRPLEEVDQDNCFHDGYCLSDEYSLWMNIAAP